MKGCKYYKPALYLPIFHYVSLCIAIPDLINSCNTMFMSCFVKTAYSCWNTAFCAIRASNLMSDERRVSLRRLLWTFFCFRSVDSRRMGCKSSRTSRKAAGWIRLRPQITESRSSGWSQQRRRGMISLTRSRAFSLADMKSLLLTRCWCWRGFWTWLGAVDVVAAVVSGSPWVGTEFGTFSWLGRRAISADL